MNNVVGTSENDIKPWYSSGLRFSCIKGCTKCCGGGPGDVFLTDKEIEKIARYLHISKERFIKKYTKITFRKTIGLKEKQNYDCILLGKTGCMIYSVRPLQCRTYPFWDDIIKTRDNWEAEKKMCPGIGKGKKYSADEVNRILGNV